MLETLQAAFAGNPFFSGGLLLGALGMLAMWLRDVPGKLASWGRQFFVVTLSFDSRDELMFTTLVEYMHAHPNPKPQTPNPKPRPNTFAAHLFQS